MSQQSTVSKLPKPQMRGLLHSAIKRNLVLVGVNVLIAGLYMKFVFGNDRKRAYAEFYRDYDIEKEFDRMRNKGLFDSCPADPK